VRGANHPATRRPHSEAYPARCIHLHGQDTTLLKRAPYKLTLAVDKKTFYEEDLKEAPYVLPNNTVQLYPGETVFIQVEQTDGIIKTIKAVKEITDSANTLTLGFTQITNGKVHQQMMLKVVKSSRFPIFAGPLLRLMSSL
jgi:hypothetical protein